MDSVLRLGGSASVLAGVAYLSSAVAFLAQPPGLRGAASPDAFWTELAAGSLAHLAVHWTSAVAGIAGLAVAPATLRLVRERSEGWALFATALAYLGFAVTARSHLMEVEFDLRVAPQYLALAPATRAAVPIVAGLALDVPHGWLTLGGVGLWVFVVSALARPSGALPGWLCWLGFATAAAFAAAVAGFSLLLLPLVTLGVGLGGALLAPLWFVGLGVALRSAASRGIASSAASG